MGMIPSKSECNPGFVPARYAVIIAPEEFPKKIGSLHIPDSVHEKEELAVVKGRLVEIAPLAFTYHDAPGSPRRSGYEDHPKPGDAIIYKKYAGILVDGDDGRQYRLCQDEDVVGVIPG